MALTIFVGALGCGSAASAQQVFSPPENDFNIVFAAPPTAQSEFPNGKAEAWFRSYTVDQAGETFALRIDQYPAHIRVPMPTKATYERLLWAHAGDTGVRFISDRPAMLSDLPCWEGLYQTANGRIEVRRILMLGDSIYQLSDTLAEGAKTPADNASFFESFKITASSLSLGRNVVGPLT